MVINGRQKKLKVVNQGGPVNGIWGLREVDGKLFVNENSDGFTSNLNFHGKVFMSREAAQAYLEGYNAARKEIASFIG